MGHHLAQVTVAKMRHEFDHPDSAGLVARVEEMNRLAEESPGFVWRLAGSQVKLEDLAGFSSLFVPFDPALVFYTLSVWASVEDLQRYVYRTQHAQMIKLRNQWIEETGLPNVAMWWISEGERPTVSESARRWRLLCEQGPTVEAFTFRQTFPATDIM